MTPTVNTTYSVTGTSSVGCNNVAMVTVSVSACTGFDKFESKDNGVNVYPNPFSSSATIEVNSLANNLIFTMYDQQGREVETIKIKNRTAGQQSLHLKVFEKSKFHLKGFFCSL